MGRGGGGERCKQHYKPPFLGLLQLVSLFLFIFFVLKTSKKRKKKWSSTELASNEAVA